MGKHKSVKEMMAERKPLTRKAVEPINIYSGTSLDTEETEQTEQKQAGVLPQETLINSHKRNYYCSR
jgi:ribosomal protein L13